MLRLVILLALAVGLAVVLYRLYRRAAEREARRRAEGPAPAEAVVERKDLAELSVMDAQLKDSISVAGAGAEFEDVDFTVDRRNRHETGRSEWYEISGLHRGQRVFLAYTDDHGLRARLRFEGGDIALAELNVGEEDLVRMDDERTRANSVEYKGDTFTYAHSSECTYFRDGLGKGEPYYGWEFRSEDGERLLYVEKWEGEPVTAGIARVIPPEDVRVFRA